MVEEHMEDYQAGESTNTANPDEDLPRYFMLTDVEVAEYSAAHQTRLLDSMEALAQRYPNASAAELISFAKNELVSREVETDMTNLSNPSGLLALTTGLEEEEPVADEYQTPVDNTWGQPGDDDLILATSGEGTVGDDFDETYEEGNTEEVPAEDEDAASVVDESLGEDVDDVADSEDTVASDEETSDVETEEAVAPVEDFTYTTEEATTPAEDSIYTYEDGESDETAEEEEPSSSTPELDYASLLDDPEDKPWTAEIPVSRIDGHELTAEEILEEDQLSDPGIPFPTQSHKPVDNGYETYQVEDEDAYDEPSTLNQDKSEPSTATGSFDPFANLDDGFGGPAPESQKNYYRGLFHEAGQIEQSEDQQH